MARFFAYFLMSVFVLPFMASADTLTKAEYFELYSKVVSRDVIKLRMDQLYSNLPDGAFKTTAKTTLKQDILDALDTKIAAANAEIQILNADKVAATNKLSAAVSALETLIAAQQDQVIPPIEAQKTDVEDTEL